MIQGKFIQTKQGMSACYEMFMGNDLCATAEIPHDIVDAELFFSGIDGEKYNLKPVSVSSLKKAGLSPYTSGKPYEIFSGSGKHCGYIFEKKKPGFLKGYVYDEIIFNGNSYVVYTVSIPKEGNKYAFYRIDKNNAQEERQVALAEKPEIVYNRLDEYTWLALYEHDRDVIGLYLLYTDYMMNAHHRMETVTSSKEVSSGKTLNKELLGKYDPEFRLKS
jgi:hypothetical protein